MVNKMVSVTEAAKLLGMSRVGVFKRIQSGRLKAERYGHIYLIPASELPTHEDISSSAPEIDRAVKRVIKEYGETLRRLAAE